MKVFAIFLLCLLLLSCRKDEKDLIPSEYKGIWYYHFQYDHPGGSAYDQDYYNPSSTLSFSNNMIYLDNGESEQSVKWHITDVNLLYSDSSHLVFTVWRRNGLKKNEPEKLYLKVEPSGNSMVYYQYNADGSLTYNSGYEKVN